MLSMFLGHKILQFLVRRHIYIFNIIYYEMKLYKLLYYYVTRSFVNSVVEHDTSMACYISLAPR